MKSYLTLIFTIATTVVFAQEQFVLSFDKFQTVENSGTSLQSQMSFPMEDSIVVLGGLNDLDGMGNYLNVYGSKLMIDSMISTPTGGHALVLRREDGKDFYNLYPTISAKLIPLQQEQKIELLNED